MCRSASAADLAALSCGLGLLAVASLLAGAAPSLPWISAACVIVSVIAGALALSTGCAATSAYHREQRPSTLPAIVGTACGLIASVQLAWAFVTGVVQLADNPDQSVPQLTMAMLAIGAAFVLYDRLARPPRR